MKKIVLIIISIVFISCSQSKGNYNPIISVSPNPNIIGEYVYYDPYATKKYIFDESDVYREYFVSSHKAADYKWKKEGEKYYCKSFTKNESWKPFNLVYVDANNIIIDGVKYTKK